MKVLILPSWYPNKKSKRGSFFREQALFLSEKGFDIKILMAEELNTKNYWYQKVISLLKNRNMNVNKEYLLQEPEAYSFPVIIQKSWSQNKKLKVLDQAYLAAYKFIKEKLNWTPDVIHIQSIYKYGLSSYTIAKKYNIPFVVIEHSFFKMTNYSDVAQIRIKEIFNSAAKIAGVSHNHKESLSSAFKSRGIEVVWNFMDENRFFINHEAKEQNKFIINTILWPSDLKGPLTFFDAVLRFLKMKNLNEEDVEVNVLGIASINELIKLKGIDNNYISKYDEIGHVLNCYSWLDRDKMLEFHQKSSVYISTSKKESFGVALREAILCGIPVISTKSGGPEDILSSNDSCLVEVGDYKSISNEIDLIYRNELPYKLKELRQKVISQCGCEAYLKRMKEFYNLNDSKST